MSHVRLGLAALLLLAPLSMLGACASEEEPGEAAAAGDDTSYEDELINAEKNGKASQKWIYNGPLPKIEKPEIFVSLKAHTVRVTGLLPKTFTGALPYYAEAKPFSDRTKLTVVYPIATGKVDPSTGQAPAAAGSYNTLFAVAYTPTNDKAPWGGFPFMMYNSKRGIAFHGPITSVTDVGAGDAEWHLYRGPVSHGCNRMAGEHDVEMAHLLGVDMAKPHSSSERFTIGAKITISNDFDTFDGKLVDVDYPAEKGVQRPTGDNVKMYPTWQSDEFPRFVCAYQADRPLPDHCGQAGEPRRDIATGLFLLDPNAPTWLGSSCEADTDCDFQAAGKKATCTRGTKAAGVCTIPCEGGCPDLAGAPMTFCATFSDGAGRCVAKAESLNNLCVSLPDTAATLSDRMIGKSTAKAAKATVCVPKLTARRGAREVGHFTQHRGGGLSLARPGWGRIPLPMSPNLAVDPLEEAERLLPLFPETALSLLGEAARSDDPETRARALALLSLHEATARSGEGLRRAGELLAQARAAGASSALTRGSIAQSAGYVAYRESNDAEALRRLNEAAALLVEHPRQRARVFDTLGMLLGRRGDLDGAFDYFSLALEHKRSSSEPRSLAITYGNLGRLALLAERFDEAERWLRLDLDMILAGAERPATVAHVHNQLALALAGQGRRAEAHTELLYALERAPTRSIVRAYVLKDLARGALADGDLSAARRHLDEAAAEVEAGAFSEVEPWLRFLSAELAARRGERALAWSDYEAAWRGFVERQAPSQACEVALAWADALAMQAQPERAREVLAGACRLAEAHLFRQENPMARIESSLDAMGPEGAAAVLQGRIRRMLGGVSEHWLLERRSGAYHARRLQGERAPLTVWTCDLRGFTEFCARTDDPRRVVRTLNRFFARVGQALLDHGGCIDKYVGDSILAYFQGERAAERACDATVDAFQRLDELNAERAHLGEPTLVMGVGVATGPVVEGNVGFAGKLEHTIIGTPVNAACRLVGRASGGQTILDATTAEALPPRFELLDLGPLDLKGLGALPSFELRGRRPA